MSNIIQPNTNKGKSMSTTKRTAFDKWKYTINNEHYVWTEQDIIFFRKAIGFCGLKDQDQRMELICAFRYMVDKRDGFPITVEQSEKGQSYLLANTLKKSGQYRKGAKLGDRELDIIRNLSHHLFVGLYPQPNGYGEVLGYLPIYRAVDYKGDSFEYTGTIYEQLEVVA